LMDWHFFNISFSSLYIQDWRHEETTRLWYINCAKTLSNWKEKHL